MKRIFALLLIAAFALTAARAEGVKVEVTLAEDEDGAPATTFAANVSKVYASFRTTGTNKGDRLRAVWIAEDVGEKAPKETKLNESSLTAHDDNFSGSFSLPRPTNGWPVGEYRVDIYSGSELATTAKFTITARKPQSDDEKDKDKDKDKDKEDDNNEKD